MTTPPFFSIGNSTGFAIEGRTQAGEWEPSDMLIRRGTPQYLATIGARLAAGRFSDRRRTATFAPGRGDRQREFCEDVLSGSNGGG